jgi:hypothetical protein
MNFDLVVTFILCGYEPLKTTEVQYFDLNGCDAYNCYVNW